MDRGGGLFCILAKQFRAAKNPIVNPFFNSSKINNHVAYCLLESISNRHFSLLRRPRPVQTTGCGQQSAAHDLHMLTRIRLTYHYFIVKAFYGQFLNLKSGKMMSRI